MTDFPPFHGSLEDFLSFSATHTDDSRPVVLILAGADTAAHVLPARFEDHHLIICPPFGSGIEDAMSYAVRLQEALAQKSVTVFDYSFLHAKPDETLMIDRIKDLAILEAPVKDQPLLETENAVLRGSFNKAKYLRDKHIMKPRSLAHGRAGDHRQQNRR